MSRLVPGPSPLPLLGPLGNMLWFRRDPLRCSERLFRTYGSLVGLVDGAASARARRPLSVVFATGAELNREILTQHDRYKTYALSGQFFPGKNVTPRTRPLLRMLTGLFHVNGDEHRRHRHLLMPSFHKARIESYRDDMVRLTEEMLAGFTPGRVIDLSAEVTRLTLRVATQTLFGDDVGEAGMQVASWLQEWLSVMFQPGMYLRSDRPFLPYRRWLDRTHQIDRAMADIVTRKRQRGGAGRDMLSMLLAARDEHGVALSDDELIGHVSVIFAAGHETSANALQWILFLLSQHPQVAGELVEELRGELRGEAPTTEQLARLPFLDAVVREALRVLPPVPLYPRYISEPCELQGYALPRGTVIFLSMYHLHHDPGLYPSPQAFVPRRFLRSKPGPFEYNPFGAGPRMCIGAAFATLELKIALALILQRVRIAIVPSSEQGFRVAITMAPRPGLRARLHPPDGRWAEDAGGIRGGVRELVDLPL
ncbi:MAG TPA: cytochrome P450 [Pseudomonadota bacterium]|nr:cytochrome P450 [Pseudomonadota bacterium]